MRSRASAALDTADFAVFFTAAAPLATRAAAEGGGDDEEEVVVVFVAVAFVEEEEDEEGEGLGLDREFRASALVVTICLFGPPPNILLGSRIANATYETNSLCVSLFVVK